MEVRKDFISVEPEVHKAFLLSDRLREIDSDWVHDKVNEDMSSIYQYDAEYYSKIDLLYSYGRSMARGLSYDLLSINNAAEYGTLYSWIHTMEEKYNGDKEFYEKIIDDALFAESKTRHFNCVSQMIQSLKEQIKILDSVLILIAILKTKDLYLLEEKVINKTNSQVTETTNTIETMEYDVFISHASEDKEKFVDEFCKDLDKEKIPYWYDSKEIDWGDSLIRKINQGLATSKFAIIVLSKNFIKKKWTNAELEAVLNIETNTGQVRVLPLMLGDSNEITEVLKEYPLLGSKKYLKAIEGNDSIIENLKKLLNK
ncbi:toll/interleukin-1 receptor domain-containing protein [Chryseobacterium culicis]|uniref:ADP-ribosyl cyclase/cyclic ADP-ribose hydrolase n=1 Tax=Chryseobacterium culicis TaxID=680127 RepID=A0A2S9CX64_CHRCI|nr:toll/interleukin-1 receptor domain-containing protein [Chryseobacterium culicis]PRB85109.1 hypothetical protein CQ022_02250 [Chryseobacterium culicis]PRB91167.1 hypothetical protein CQ033_10740 [Chryseobacterium culicis]